MHKIGGNSASAHMLPVSTRIRIFSIFISLSQYCAPRRAFCKRFSNLMNMNLSASRKARHGLQHIVPVKARSCREQLVFLLLREVGRVHSFQIESTDGYYTSVNPIGFAWMAGKRKVHSKEKPVTKNRRREETTGGREIYAQRKREAGRVCCGVCATWTVGFICCTPRYIELFPARTSRELDHTL